MTALADMDARTRHALRDSFFAAARLGETDDLRTILSNYPELLNAKDDKDDATPLILAAEGGHMLAVKLLVESKADIFLTDSADRTALYAAAQKGRGLVAEYLVEEGLDPEAEGEVGLSPVGIADNLGYKPVVDLMRQAREFFLQREAEAQKVAASAQAALVSALGQQIQGGTREQVAAPSTARFSKAPRR